MKFDFDKIINRRNTNSIKWDVAENELPMWVADMDFETSPAIIDAVASRVALGHFGYSDVTDDWYDAYISWWKRRHNFEMEKDWLIFSSGVVPAISSIVRKLSTPAEKVVVQTPCYNIFFNSIVNNGRMPVESPLKIVETERVVEDFEETGAKTGRKSVKERHYACDFQRLEQDLSDPQVRLMILCNPQNPTGEIWDKETLTRIAELCDKYDVTVISDEAHCDIVVPGKEYIPFASVSETARKVSVSLLSPSKTFNVAGMHSAAVVVPDPKMRHKVWRGLNTDEVAEPNAFAIVSAVAAYKEEVSEEWCDEMNAYVAENKKFAVEFLKKKFPAELPPIYVFPGDSTYLIWIDMHDYLPDFAKYLRKHTGLFLSDGAAYGLAGRGFVRMNLACPRSIVEEGCKRLITGARMFAEEKLGK